MAKVEGNSITGFASAAAGAAGLFCAVYLSGTHFRDAEPICLATGCSSWYQSGPFSSIGSIPLAVIGLCVWLAIFTMLRFVPSRKRLILGTAWVFAFTADSLQVVGYQATGTYCLWCLSHAIFATVFAITLLRANIPPLRDASLPVFAVLIGTGMAFLSPRDLSGVSSAGIALTKEPLDALRPAGVWFYANANPQKKVVAVVDLNCGHCVNWLQHTAAHSDARHPLMVVWASIVKGEMPSDANHVADGIGADPEKLRRYFATGCKPAPGIGKGPRDARRNASEKLFDRLGIGSTPHFIVYEVGTAKAVGSAKAYATLFEPE